MSPKRIVVLSYVAFAVIFGYVLTRVVTRFAFEAFRINNPHFFDLEELSLASLLGYGLAVLGAVVAYRNTKLNEISYEVASELRKVTWPSMPEIRTATAAVIIASAVCAVVLGVFYDYLGSKIMTDWIPSALNWIAMRS
jgi:preprotein translocase subunit SecE